MFLTKFVLKTVACWNTPQIVQSYLLLYLGAALPTLTEVGALISVAQVLACLALPVAACSTFLHY